MVRNVLLAGAVALAVSCGQAAPVGETGTVTMDAPERTRPTLRVAMAPTSGQTAAGTLMVSDTANGIRLTGRLTGLPADRELGFHVHEVGDCSAPDASSAGDHFNPDQQPHGHPDRDRRHAGDMPNLDVDDEGVADVDVTLEGLSIEGPSDRSVRQRAVVVHARADDYETQPSGASGDPIACGVIEGDAAGR